MTALLTWLLDGDRPTYQLWLGLTVGVYLGGFAALLGALLAQRERRRRDH